MTKFDEQQLRLIAAKVLDEGPYKHDKVYIRCASHGMHEDCTQECPSKCRKCGQGRCADTLCPIPDLPTEPLEVLGERCKAKCGSLEYTKALFEQLGCDFNRRGDMELIAVAWAATSADKIIAAAKAGGIE